MKRRLGMVVGVLVMAAIAYSMREAPSPDDSELPDTTNTETTEPDSQQPTDDELGPRRSLRTPRRMVEAPRHVEFIDAEDAPGGEVRGRVEDRLTGEPIDGAELTFEHEGSLHVARSGDDGLFRFASPAEGLFTLVLAEADGYFSYAPAYGHARMLFTTAAGRAAGDVTIRLEAASTLQVRVHGPNGDLVTAALHVLGMPEGSLSPSEERFMAVDGIATLRAPEDSVVEARQEGLVGRARVDAAAVLTGVVHIHLAAVPGGEPASLRGQVLSLLTSDPIPGALVEVQVQGPDGDFVLARVLTDEDGEFSYAARDGGPFTLWTVAGGYAGERREDVTPGQDAVILLSEEASLEGRVTDEEGVPIQSFLVFAEAHLGALERELRGHAGVFDADGRFHLGGLSSGGYSVSVSADGFAPATRDVLLARGERARVPEIQLRRGAVVEGQVLGADGPIAGARIQIESAIGGVGLPLSAERLSDAEGFFRVGGLSGGTAYLTVAAEGHHARILAAETGGDAIEITLNAVGEGEETQLELAGIGAALRADEDTLLIDVVVAGGGAEAAGLLAGESIVAIDGVSVDTFDFREAIARIRGPVGSIIHVRVASADGELREVNVTRVLVRTN